MNTKHILEQLPNTDMNVMSVISGGMDSTIMTRILVEKYGANRVVAISYNYGQKQSVELQKAAESCAKMGVKHLTLDLSILGQVTQNVCANIKGTDVQMPSIQDVLGEPQPPTYVPYRNMILLSLTMAAAESNNASHVFTGIQVHDTYGYWDTTQEFVNRVNHVSELNRKHQIQVCAPFASMSKADELNVLKELDGSLDLLKSTLTCYDPDEHHRSCGSCPSCAERIKAFMDLNEIDPIEYSKEIPWR